MFHTLALPSIQYNSSSRLPFLFYWKWFSMNTYLRTISLLLTLAWLLMPTPAKDQIAQPHYRLRFFSGIPRVKTSSSRSHTRRCTGIKSNSRIPRAQGSFKTQAAIIISAKQTIIIGRQKEHFHSNILDQWLKYSKQIALQVQLRSQAQKNI